MTDGPDPFESAVVGIIRILAPWPPEQRAKILQGADYCMHCGQQLSNHRPHGETACSVIDQDTADFDAH